MLVRYIFFGVFPTTGRTIFLNLGSAKYIFFCEDVYSVSRVVFGCFGMGVIRININFKDVEKMQGGCNPLELTCHGAVFDYFTRRGLTNIDWVKQQVYGSNFVPSDFPTEAARKIFLRRPGG